MKSLIYFVIIIISFTTFAQDDFATVTIYRTKAFCIGCNVKILLNDVYLTELENGGKLELKVYNINNTKLTVTDGQTYRDDVSLKLSKGQTYYLNVQAKMPRSLGFRFDQLYQPIKDKKLNSDRFLSMTDVGVIENNIARNPDTDWTKERLKKHWTENGFDNIEGIYERVGVSFKYELAVLRENNEYKIIYLSGIRDANWLEGDIKAYLTKTAQFGLLKANWFMLNKTQNDNVLIKFNNATMEYLPTSGDSKEVYIKIYPTYDDTNNSVSSNLKTTGSGFLIDKKGLVVTNYHVIENGNSFEVVVTKNSKPESFQAIVISTDRQNDLAILKITSPDFIPFDNLKYNFNTNTQDVGLSVFALGFPLTDIMGQEIKFTDGKISSRSGFQGDITTYQISATLNPGNSGGPLFDEKGNLVGINSSGINKLIANNANYAIKTSYLKLLIDSTNENIELPNSTELSNKDVTEQIKILSEYVVLIKVK